MRRGSARNLSSLGSGRAVSTVLLKLGHDLVQERARGSSPGSSTRSPRNALTASLEGSRSATSTPPSRASSKSPRRSPKSKPSSTTPVAPTTGSQTHMTWKTLETASGPATRVPQQVKAILSGDAQKRAQGVHALLTTLVQSGRWFSASALTTDLILRSVADAPPDAPGAGRALWLALDIATAINEDFLRGLHSWQSAPEADECRKVIEQAQPRLLRLLAHDDPSVRAPAAALLALGQGDRDAAARALGARRTVETDPFALAHLLLASGFLHLFAGERHPGLASELTPFLADDQPDLVRTAAALAHLASTHDLSPAAAKALPAALHEHLRPDTVGWCDGRWPHLVAAVARRLGDVAPVLTRALREDLEDSELYSTNQKRYWARIALD